MGVDVVNRNQGGPSQLNPWAAEDEQEGTEQESGREGR